MNTDQIAAEAAKRIEAELLLDGKLYVARIEAIIQAAIEKAVIHACQAISGIEPGTRAAQARELAPDEARDAYINDYDAGSAEGDAP